MKGFVKAGKADHTVDVFILDSSSTTGAGLTGLAYNTASLVCYYRKGATGSATAITLATQTVGGAHADGGFVEISSANMPGLYRLDLPDAVIDTAGVSKVMLKGATNMAPVILELQCVAFNPDDGVRLGLTALPNAAADAAGGLIISDAGGLDADAQRSDVAAILVDTGTTLDGRIPAALVSGRMDASVGAYQTGLTPLQPTTAGRTLDVSAGGEAGLDWANIGSPTTSQTLSGTTISTSQAVASVSGSVGSVTGAVGSVTGSVGSVTGNVGGNVTGSVGSVAAGGITASSIATGAVDADALASDAVAEIVAGVLDEPSASHIAAGSVGERIERLDIILAGGAGELTAARAALLSNADAAVSTRATPAQVATELATYDGPTNAEMEARTLVAASYGTAANQTTILARLGAWTGSGINTILGALRAMAAKAAALTPTDISTGTTYDNTTDSLEAVRDNQSAGGGATAQQVWEYGTRSLTTAGPVTVVSPVNPVTLRVAIYRGDDYNASDTGREIAWESTGWPDLTSATITFTARTRAAGTLAADAVAITASGTVVTPTGTAKVRANLTAALTNVDAGIYSYDVQAVLATSSRVITLAAGTLEVKEHFSR